MHFALICITLGLKFGVLFVQHCCRGSQDSEEFFLSNVAIWSTKKVSNLGNLTMILSVSQDSKVSV